MPDYMPAPLNSFFRFVSIHDNFVRAIAVHQNTAKNTDVLAMMRDFVGMEQPKEIPEVVTKFLEINRISSEHMRREAGLAPNMASEVDLYKFGEQQKKENGVNGTKKEN